MIIEQNSIEKDLWAEKIHPAEKISEDIVFSNSFTQKPFILLSLERIDTGQFIEQSNFQKNGQRLLHSVNRIDMKAENITTEGFSIRLKTWGNNKIYGYRISWTAISPEE